MLYGNKDDMSNNHQAGTKYLWVGNEGVLEMHGEEKLSWTHLDEHLFRDNVAAEQLHFQQFQWAETFLGNRLGSIEKIF